MHYGLTPLYADCCFDEFVGLLERGLNSTGFVAECSSLSTSFKVRGRAVACMYALVINVFQPPSNNTF